MAGGIAITAYLISKAKKNKTPVEAQRMQTSVQNLPLNNNLPQIYENFKLG